MLKNQVSFLLLFAASQLLIFPKAFSQAPKPLKTIVVDAGHGGTDAGAVGQYENSLRSKEKDVTLAISMKLVAQLQKDLPDVKTIPTRTTDIYQDPREKARLANQFGGQLFICIHADSGPLKQGKRQIGTKTVTRYKISYSGKGKHRKKISTPYQVEEPVYEYYKIPLQRKGTSVWIFAPHKTDIKLQTIMNNGEDFEIDLGSSADSATTNFDFNTPEGRMLAQIYMTRFQKRSDNLATLVNDEIEKTGRPSLGVNQRQKGIWVLQATNMPAILVETGFINNPEDEAYLNSEAGQQELAEVISRAVIRYKDQIEHPTKAATNTVQQ
ncbi:MAG TPA: N-acetylmuramoyl-L-alanine amidase [Ferruginibacter sp.]|nr:N-acetylmuramoyl-L-alanine amidase [Ferruginibacter sp.]